MGDKLRKMNLLEGEEETITSMEFRASPGEVLSQVELGKRYLITRYGKIVAEIRRPEPTALDLGAAVRALGLVEEQSHE